MSLARQAETAADPEGRDDRHFVAAVARAFDVLRAWAPGDDLLGTGEIARRAGLPKSTASRLIATLARLGVLETDAATGRHRLGAALLPVARAFLSARPLMRLARPVMERLAAEAHAAIALSERDGDAMLYLDYARADATVVVALGPGTRVPLAETAAGRAWLAAAEEAELAALLDRQGRAEGERAALLAAAAEARAELASLGHVRAMGRWRAEVNAVGVPLPLPADPSRRLALTLAAPAFLVPAERMERELAPLLRAAADEILRRAGGRGAP